MNNSAVRAILCLTADAGSLASVETYRLELLRALTIAFPCDVVVFNEFRLEPSRDRRLVTASCASSPPLEPRDVVPPALLAAFARHMNEHPLLHVHAAGHLGSYRLSDVTSVRRFRRTALYGEFHLPTGIEHQLALSLEASPRRLSGIWFNRVRRGFSDDDLLVAELLRPRLQAGEVAVRRAAARAALTVREREVLDIVSTGAANAAIAEALVVSPATVKKHLDNIYAKLGVSTRADAADRAAAVL